MSFLLCKFEKKCILGNGIQRVDFGNIITSCQHIFCSKCLVPHLEGKMKNEGSCPVCETLLNPSDLIAPKFIAELFKNYH